MTVVIGGYEIAGANPAAILDASYKLAEQAPVFGVPTLVLRPEKHVRKNAAAIDQTLRETFADFFAVSKKLYRFDFLRDKVSARFYSREQRQKLYEDVAQNPRVYREAMIEARYDNYFNATCWGGHEGNNSDLIYKKIGARTPYAVIQAPKMNMDGRARISCALNVAQEYLPAYPGSKSEWQFATLFHEYSHVRTELEAACDWGSALAARQAFGQTKVLPVRADFRISAGVLRFDNYDHLQKYGLPCSQEIDRVIAMPQSEVDALTEGDIIDKLDNATYDHREAEMLAAGGVLQRACHDAFSCRRLDILYEETDRLLRQQDFGRPDGETHAIAERFRLAVYRLHKGIVAYENAYQPAPALVA